MSIIMLDTDNAYLVVTDLLTDEKRVLLGRTLSGPLAIPLLEAIAPRLAVVTRKGKPYAAELSDADRRHDVGAVVLDDICRIYEVLGSLPQFAELTESAQKVRATLSMSRSIITASYGQSAANALRNRQVIDEVDAVLRAMPIAPGVSARDVAELFISGGEDIGDLLRKRASALAAAQAARAETSGANLLAEARDLLLRIRTMLDSEVSMRDDLPADLVDRIFSMLDERIAVAVARNSRGGAAAVDGEGADGTEAAPLDLDAGGAPNDAAPQSGDAGAPDAPAAPAASEEDPPPVRPLPDRD